MSGIKILFLSDTHLGFDLPFRPRIERRRRGDDFFANFERALEPARQGKVDCVVHGGDILYRSKVPAELVAMAFQPLKQLADQGMPVYVVPGNHERSGIPYGLLAHHPKIHLFDRPKTFGLDVNGFRLGLAGFPCVRNGIRRSFRKELEKTGWQNESADGYILCMHQSVEGAVVGPVDYVFRNHQDVISASDIPSGFAAILSGHIHRFQVLTRDLRGKLMSAPVFYPGSIERTSFAEKDEKKGYLFLEVGPGGKLTRWRFCELPARPMLQVELDAHRMKRTELKRSLESLLTKLPSDGVVRVRISGQVQKEALPVLIAASLRALAPPTMNLSVKLVDR
jgi:DNA repair exonuclease SbcCD nuclease subunit